MKSRQSRLPASAPTLATSAASIVSAPIVGSRFGSSSRWLWVGWKVVRAVSGGLALLACLTSFVCSDDQEAMDEYLARLGLVEIRMLHLERVLEQETMADRRELIARRLADLLAERMINEADDRQVFEETSARIERLLHREPNAGTKALEVARLQGDYRRAESQFSVWMDDRTAVQALDEARGILVRITPRLLALQGDLQQESAALSQQAEKAPTPEQQSRLERELTRTATVAARATFFAAWSSYYAGAAQIDSPQARPHFLAALAAFSQLLDQENPLRYGELKSEWMGLESLWRARAWIGIGLTEIALGNLSAAATLFGLLESTAALPTIRDHLPYWYFSGLMNANRITEAVEWAAQRSSKMTAEATPGKIAFHTALVRSGLAIRSVQPSAPWKKLIDTGIHGLSRMKQVASVQALLVKYDLPLDARAGFGLLFARGQHLFQEAERGSSAGGFRSAIPVLQLALANAEGADARSVAQCQQTLGWCHYRLEEFEVAAQNFRQASERFQGQDLEAGADAAWMAFVAHQARIKQQPQAKQAAIQALQWLCATFPNSPRSERAEFQLSRLQAGEAGLDDRIRKLEAIRREHPDYAAARADLCQALYERWSQSVDRAAADREAAVVIDAAQAYRDLSRTSRSDAVPNGSALREYHIALHAAEVALSSRPQAMEVARSFLQRGVELASSLNLPPEQAVELHYRLLQLAQQQGNHDELHRRTEFLLQHASGTSFELPGIMLAAKELDAELKGLLQQPRRKEAQEHAKRVYRRLVSLLGDDRTTLQSRSNARVALARLAQLEADTDEQAKSARHWQLLLGAFPQERIYLLPAAKASHAAGEFGNSLDCWRRLLAGLEKGSDDWLEAKYYQIDCLQHTDPVIAQQVWEQFRLLYPEGGPEVWSPRFRELERKLSRQRGQ